jgi:steroid delta-isomerase-like uncharacterized protein
MARSARGFVADYIAAMNRHDVQGVVNFFADDSTYEDAAIGTVRRGRAEIEEFVAFFFSCYEDVKYTPHSVVGDDERIAWEWTLEANYARTSHTGVPATGQKVCVRGASFMRVRDSVAVWNTDYWDINTMRRQIEAGSAEGR